MRIEKRKKKARLLTLHGYLGYWQRCKFLLAVIGFSKPLNTLNKQESDYVLHVCYVKKHHINPPRGWEALQKAEVAFATSLAPRLEELKQAHCIRIIKNLAGEIIPIVHMKKTARLIGEQPRFTNCVALRAENTLYFHVSCLYAYLREAHIEERVITTWDNRKACCFDRETALLYLEKLMMPGAHREGKRNRLHGPRKLEKQQYGGWTIPLEFIKKLAPENDPFSPI